jgi:glutamine synthetase
MIRVLGSSGDPAARLENRVGEPAANPYLFMASQIFTGLDGMERMLDSGPSADTPYEAQALHLPKTLDEALRALRNDNCLADGFGRSFIDYYLRIKDAEIALSGRGDGVGAAGIFRVVLDGARPSRSNQRGGDDK